MTSIDNMAAEIMKGLTEYADLAYESMKKAVKKTSAAKPTKASTAKPKAQAAKPTAGKAAAKPKTPAKAAGRTKSSSSKKKTTT